MGARLISWPDGLGLANITIVSGPVSSGSSDEQSTITGGTQYVSAPFAPWAFRATVVKTQGQLSRRAGGTFTATHSGANALRLPWNLIADAPNPLDLGLSAGQELEWSNGQPWDNGRGWLGTYPTESVVESAAKGQSIVKLGTDAWGDRLGMGDWFGFDGHFALYRVTETFPSAENEYRVWPPLRKAITTDSVATLEPVLGVQSIGRPQMTKSPAIWEDFELTLKEIPDETLRAYYTL